MKTNNIIDIAVIGGGASGLACAIAAKHKADCTVTIFEGLDRVGKKILATGNGRCNLTNVNASPKHYHTKNSFADYALNKHSAEDNIKFFSELSLFCVSDSQGRVYPAGNQASAVLDCLRFEVLNSGVSIVCGEHIDKIEKQNGFFIINSKYKAKNVVICTGGKSAPKQGSDGSGFTLAKSLGHKITRLSPALVQTNCDGNFFRSLKGIRQAAKAELIIDSKHIATETGEIQFTQNGLSGIAVMQLSSLIARSNSRNIIIKLDCAEKFDSDTIINTLLRFSKANPRQTLDNFLLGIVPKRLGEVILKQAGFKDLSHTVGGLSKKEIAVITEKLKNWEIKINSLQGFDVAQVTSGGVATDEVDSRTLMSKLVPCLYFAGEVLDVDGECGGYNLNWAWSSGRLVGEYIAERLQND